MNTIINHKQFVGIDLGTTNTVVSFFDESGKPKTIPIDGEPKTPSVVYVGDSEAEDLVGTPAYNMQLVAPERTIREAKRDVGTDKCYGTFRGVPITPEWCQAKILASLRAGVQQYFGDENAGRQAVITVPAYFAERERQSVVRSATQAGFTVLQLINEPTAASLAYGLSAQQGDRLLITLDFGGGTFDVSVIQFAGGHVQVLASAGDKQLGGKDVDDALLSLVTEAFRREHKLKLTADSHPADFFALREEVIRQKHLLAARTEVQMAARVEGKQVLVKVTRSEFAALLEPLMARIERTIQQVIGDAKVNPADIKHVLLVGGSSRLHVFQELVKRLFGPNALPDGQTSPDLSVSEGAAIHAAKLVSTGGAAIVNDACKAIPAPTLKTSDVLPHSLGVCVQDRATSRRQCSVILPRNTPLPCRVSKQYGSVDDEQTRFRICVVQGEEGQVDTDCLVVGERELDLPARSREKESLDVTMGYDASGLASVVVRDLVSGKSEDITIKFGADGSQNTR